MTDIATAVLDTVAEKEGVDTSELSPPLYDVVDPEALDTLLEADGARVTFEYLGYEVTAESDGTVTATEVVHRGAAR